ncbi:hypothetical protein [Tengunoibacter tsumagoiensis]|uniref:Uncharacterized protein n=1 Tax=Tengunoibacter tsumagoiensis TaxID=2014871 RepID=A0A402A617_9CHLR|nr:hypothetical protein [Tengunoibacter tsumagoiensis]GCE14476.1 hypothetical protein KTT_43350 [Tengunoibacter tsumagoiensis]
MNKDANNDASQLQVNDLLFNEIARGTDYVLYQASASRTIDEITIDLFLEQVPDKGWWGALRLNDRFKIQLHLDHDTLFPTPEIAHLAIEDFLSNRHQVSSMFEEMRHNGQNSTTFSNVPPRPATIDPDKYFSPVILEVNEIIFTLYRHSKAEATYRSWTKRQMGEITAELFLSHKYWNGWKTALKFLDGKIAIFEQEIDQAFRTPELALETLFSFCTESVNRANLAQQMEKLQTQDVIAIRNQMAPIATTKPPLRVNDSDFIWQKQTSQGELYQARKARFINLNKAYIQLLETKEKGWSGGLKFKDIEEVYFEKAHDVGFATPEEALAMVSTFISTGKINIRMLRFAHKQRIALQCKIGRYDQIVSINSNETSSSDHTY